MDLYDYYDQKYGKLAEKEILQNQIIDSQRKGNTVDQFLREKYGAELQLEKDKQKDLTYIRELWDYQLPILFFSKCTYDYIKKRRGEYIFDEKKQREYIETESRNYREFEESERQQTQTQTGCRGLRCFSMTR